MSDDVTQSYKANFISTMKNIFGLSGIDKNFISIQDKNDFIKKIEEFCESEDILYVSPELINENATTFLIKIAPIVIFVEFLSDESLEKIADNVIKSYSIINMPLNKMIKVVII